MYHDIPGGWTFTLLNLFGFYGVILTDFISGRGTFCKVFQSFDLISSFLSATKDCIKMCTMIVLQTLR